MHSDSIFNPFFLLHDPDNWGSVKLVVTSESVMQHNSQLGQFFSGTVLQLRKLSQTRYILCSRRYYPLLIFQKTIPDPLPAAAAPTSIQVVRNDIRINCFFPLRPLPLSLISMACFSNALLLGLKTFCTFTVIRFWIWTKIESRNLSDWISYSCDKN